MKVGERVRVAKGIVIYRRDGTTNWWIDAQGGGERIRRSLDTPDRSEAIQKALDIFKRRIPVNSVKTLTIADAFEKFLSEKKDIEHRPKTGKRYRSSINSFFNLVGPERDPNSISKDVVKEWQRRRLADHAPDTVNGDVGNLKAFFNWMFLEEITDRDPSRSLTKVPVNRSKRTTLDVDKFSRLVRAIMDEEFLYDYVRFLAATSLRPTEGLRVRGCDLQGDILDVIAWGGWKTKDNEDRGIQLSATALEIAQRRKLMNGNDQYPLFHGRVYKARGVTIRDARTVWRDLKPLIPEGIRLRNGLYELRHYAITRFVEAGWDVEKVQKYVGHSDIRTTKRYYVHCERKVRILGAPPDLALTPERTAL